jgi:hypothetical protein
MAHRRGRAPFRQRQTRWQTASVLEKALSIRLVVPRARISSGGRPRRWQVKVSASPSRRLAAAAGYASPSFCDQRLQVSRGHVGVGLVPGLL